VQGRVVGPGQVAILVARPQFTASLAATNAPSSINVAENSKVE
jgi:hypothetical protein